MALLRQKRPALLVDANYLWPRKPICQLKMDKLNSVCQLILSVTLRLQVAALHLVAVCSLKRLA